MGAIEKAVSQAAQLRANDVAALTTLLVHRNASIDELSDIMGLTHSGAVRLVDRLEAGSLLTRGEAQDGRAVALSLTGKGRRRAGLALEARSRVMAHYLDALDSREREQLMELLEKLLFSLPLDRDSVVQVCRLCDYAPCQPVRAGCPVRRGVFDREERGVCAPP
jgi:DNA-binding MarR family transcriptional regulator